MNEILKIIEERELYSHLILAKVYLGTKGRTDEIYNGDLKKELKILFGEEFELDTFNTATNFLYSENYVSHYTAGQLTPNGRKYFENFVRNYQNINENDRELLTSKLPEKIVTFFGFASNVATIADFLINITKIK